MLPPNHLHDQGVREKVQESESCDVSDGDKQDCGHMGTNQVFIIAILVFISKIDFSLQYELWD